jgi:4-hydroxythreonine-4-phosphate dehydrogenase
MMASSELIVSLATIHVALERVKGLLTRRGILEVILLTADALRRLGRRVPSIAVCGLNPHAGEHGIFGDEERRIIAPAIAEARAKGLRVEGPLPPDTAFLPPKRRAVDAYVAMYHDQGLIPFKLLAFERGVNITLGLPIVRTSVDHGTAFDIAWQGKASAASLIESIRWAARLAGAGPG